MAKCIARSKGMLLPEFVADISRHTADRGYELRYAMQVEVSSFNEYVERIITQRIKDVGELLDDKQRYEVLKLHKDCDRWQSELSVCKNRLKEIIPDFDLNAYRRDKNYMKSLFAVVRIRKFCNANTTPSSTLIRFITFRIRQTLRPKINSKFGRKKTVIDFYGMSTKSIN